jgi:hypothetical protein
VQGFEKVPALRAMAPTQSEPPFLVAQLVVMALFIVLTIVAVKKFLLTPVADAPRFLQEQDFGRSISSMRLHSHAQPGTAAKEAAFWAVIRSEVTNDPPPP